MYPPACPPYEPTALAGPEGPLREEDKKRVRHPGSPPFPKEQRGCQYRVEISRGSRGSVQYPRASNGGGALTPEGSLRDDAPGPLTVHHAQGGYSAWSGSRPPPLGDAAGEPAHHRIRGAVPFPRLSAFTTTPGSTLTAVIRPPSIPSPAEPSKGCGELCQRLIEETRQSHPPPDGTATPPADPRDRPPFQPSGPSGG